MLDTNIMLDYLLDRQPFSQLSSQIVAAIESGVHAGFLCATTMTTLDYLIQKSLGVKESKKILIELLNMFEIAPVTRTVLESAISNHFPDFEDAVLHEAARHLKLDAIITRNQSDFKQAKIAIYSPQEFLAAGN